MLLISCIACCEVKQARNILAYGRENTFLLRLTKDLVRIVVDLTDDEGTLKGDHQLMRLIIEHGTVLKPDDLQTTIAK